MGKKENPMGKSERKRNRKKHAQERILQEEKRQFLENPERRRRPQKDD